MRSPLISKKVLKAYFAINIPLVVFGYILYLLLECASSSTVGHDAIVWAVWSAQKVMAFFVKNLAILLAVDKATKGRKDIVSRTDAQKSMDINVMAYVLKFSFFESLTYDCGVNFGLIVPISSTTGLSPLWFAKFIILSFAFEVIFDFFHYWVHRVVHDDTYWYQKVHKLHHKSINPNVYDTFDDTILGIVFTNAVPQIFTMAILSTAIGPLSRLDFAVIAVYKTFVEISGHSGKTVGGASAFPQFKWLPCLLKIDLYTEDHHLHHRNCKYNFSKRFTLWDKVFQTYKHSNDT